MTRRQRRCGMLGEDKSQHWFWNEDLHAKAMRTVGLLVTRRPASSSALLARRRCWIESDKLILFLSDDDLAEIVLARSRDEDPGELLDAQLDSFLTSLVP